MPSYRFVPERQFFYNEFYYLHQDIKNGRQLRSPHRPSARSIVLCRMVFILHNCTRTNPKTVDDDYKWHTYGNEIIRNVKEIETIDKVRHGFLRRNPQDQTTLFVDKIPAYACIDDSLFAYSDAENDVLKDNAMRVPIKGQASWHPFELPAKHMSFLRNNVASFDFSVLKTGKAAEVAVRFPAPPFPGYFPGTLMPTVFNDANDIPTVDDGEGHDNKTPWAVKFLEAFFSKFPAVTCV